MKLSLILRRHSYVVSKIIRYLLILYIIISINFLIPRMMPGDPIINLLGEDAANLTPDMLAELRHKYDLDAPILDQYLNYLGSIARLDLGYSIHMKLPVADLIADHMMATLKLVVPAVIVGSIMAIVFGVMAGFWKGKLIDRALTTSAMLIYSVPTFLLGIIVLHVFSSELGWFPLGHLSSGRKEGLEGLIDSIYHLFLPVMVLAISGACSKFLVVRNSIAQILEEYFIFVASAKGLSERTIAFRHVLRNILPQFISAAALSFGFMVSGALLIEIVFSIKGMGMLTYEAVLARDYPVLQGVFLVLTISVLLANFIAEILYGLADPRIRHSQQVVEKV